MNLNQVRDDFGVGFGVHFDSVGFEEIDDFEIVFDDAVVDDCDFAVVGKVRVGVGFGGLAVG